MRNQRDIVLLSRFVTGRMNVRKKDLVRIRMVWRRIKVNLL